MALDHREALCDPASLCPESPEGHRFEREVRDHPIKRDRKQDRMACGHCGTVIYDWGRAFRE